MMMHDAHSFSIINLNISNILTLFFVVRMNDSTLGAQDGNLHSFAESFHCPPSNTNSNTNSKAPPPKKAKRRRKRHAPPGPAGVWFQSQLVNTTNSDTNSNHHTTARTTKHEENMAAPDVSSCPAWMWMQASLNLCTPYLPRHYSVQERFHHLRPLLPRDYILLPELLDKTSPLVFHNQQLLVLVHAAAVQYHSYWTLELRDECGASIKAWMDPLLDEKEMLELLQMGVVWLLQDVVVLVDSSNPTNKWLLLTKHCIQRAWTPLQASKDFSDAQYIEWMTKRSQFNSANQQLNGEQHAPSSGRMEQEAQQEEEEGEQQVIDVDTAHAHQQQDQNEDEEEEDVVAILPRTFAAAASRSVVTPRFTTTSSSATTAPRLPTNADVRVNNNNNNSSNSVTAELLQGVTDTPQVATASNDDARRVQHVSTAACIIWW